MEETVASIDAVQRLAGMQQETEKFAERSLESYFRERVALVNKRYALSDLSPSPVFIKEASHER